jgi:hypothetical protein
MMGRQNNDHGPLFYEFCLDEAVPADHLVRKIDAVLDLSWVHAELAPHYPTLGRPSVDPVLMIRMLIMGMSLCLCATIRAVAVSRAAGEPRLSVVLQTRHRAQNPRSRSARCIAHDVSAKCPPRPFRGDEAGGRNRPRPRGSNALDGMFDQVERLRDITVSKASMCPRLIRFDGFRSRRVSHRWATTHWNSLFSFGAASKLDRMPRFRHSPTVRTTLEVGRVLTVLPPNSFMIASSYSGRVFTGSFAFT